MGGARVVRTPESYEPDPGDPLTLYLAGPVAGAPDWQAHAMRVLAGEAAVLLNPRPVTAPVDEPAAHAEHARWAHHHRRRASVMLFWFPAICGPDGLVELGAALAVQPTDRLAVGVDPECPYRRDVLVQAVLERPDLPVRETLEDTITDASAILRRDQPDSAGADTGPDRLGRLDD